jgi:hypothetical protein
MHLTRLLCGTVLIASGCASMSAQTAPLTPSPLVPTPFQFDSSKYKLLLPNPQVILKPGLAPGNKPCAVARIMKPNEAIDPQMIPQHSGPAPMPIEIHSRDITEMNVPAPSCADIPAPEKP